MNVSDLIERWVQRHNSKFREFLQNKKEPRTTEKTFFIYSYNLLNRLGNDWSDYLKKYRKIFRRDPSKDYYYNRDVESYIFSLEWTNTFEIVDKVGFPVHESPKEKLLRYAVENLEKAKGSPLEKAHDIMLCAAIEHLLGHCKDLRKFEEFEDLKKLNLKAWMKNWLSNSISTIKKEASPHQIIAYLNALTEIKQTEKLEEDLLKWLHQWINDSHNTSRQRRLLISARIATQLIHLQKNQMSKTSEEILKALKRNFFDDLKEIKYVSSSHNVPIVLEAFYRLSNEKKQRKIEEQLLKQLGHSDFFELKELFPFLEKDKELTELDTEIKNLKEKCSINPTRNDCKNCLSNRQLKCWMKVLGKILGEPPEPHGPFEVADVTVYTPKQGIYFVIKSQQISGQRQGGDTLYRQCTELLQKERAIVLYVNPHQTSTKVIERIRETANKMKTNPRFIPIRHKYLRQIYQYYKDIWRKEK